MKRLLRGRSRPFPALESAHGTIYVRASDFGTTMILGVVVGVESSAERPPIGRLFAGGFTERHAWSSAAVYRSPPRPTWSPAARLTHPALRLSCAWTPVREPGRSEGGDEDGEGEPQARRGTTGLPRGARGGRTTPSRRRGARLLAAAGKALGGNGAAAAQPARPQARWRTGRADRTERRSPEPGGRSSGAREQCSGRR